jgi:hypothetical protein
MAEEHFGITGLSVTPVHGSWLGNPEPAFVIAADNLTFEAATELGNLLGFAMAQDAVVTTQPYFEESGDDAIRAVYIGDGKPLTDKQLSAVMAAAKDRGIELHYNCRRERS